ncbi:MAG: APC family permease [Acidobacteriota bacterium]
MAAPIPSTPERRLGLRDLILFNLAAVTSTRALAAAAHTGSGSVWLWLSACLLFFIPSALCVSALARRMPQEGGLYIWTRESFGHWHGFLCGYCYWLNNLFYFPSLILAGAAMSAFILGSGGEALSENPAFALTLSIAVLWAVTWLNIRCLQTGKWLGNIGGLSTMATGGVLILLAAAYLLHHHPATILNWRLEWNWDKLNFWPQIAFAFGGLELGAIMGAEVDRPTQTIPRAAWASGALITAFYFAGTVSLLILLTPDAISPVTGLTQAASAAGSAIGMPWLPPIVALLMTAGIFGQFSVWLAGSARLPFVLGIDRHMPAAFAKPHVRYGTPSAALLFQAIACTAFLLLMHAGENLRTGYQLLVDMTVITYFIPYLYLFAAAWKNKRSAAAVSGFAVTAFSLAISFVPPGSSEHPWLFVAKLAGGTAIMIGFARFWYGRHAAT